MEEKTVIKNEKGQLSIFLGVSLLVVITMLAFIINVGLFVKAKINLQNAVDSAAYAGASVQARQLTNIAYLNWEMRNTYKEWMFKYYVLGNMGLKSTLNPQGQNMNFRMVSFFGEGEAENTGKNWDPYNAPSICIHFGSPHNICEIYDVPGLPRFQTVGLPSISPHHEAFLNNIAKIKANNCSVRSDINMGVAMIWAYGIGSNLFQDSPQIAAKRVGAWPQAVELGMRIRNLEMLVNRPAISETPICMNGSDGCMPVEQLNNMHPEIPLDERPIKAFYSAYRNLGGGSLKSSSPGAESKDELSGSFKLYEIPPQPIDATNTLGEMLIPLDRPIGNTGVLATQKQYLDLWAWPINLGTFYTIFTSDTEEGFANAGVSAEAGCKGTKTVLPVPGYLFGFSKNPNSLTYYAVKGEAKYIGMMFPFTEQQGITLQAYAAAKPFGGRIGPMLFTSNGQKGVAVRKDSIVGKSVPYVSVFETSSAGGAYEAGFPIPYNDTFFAKSTDMIGGLPGANSDAKFVIPNMVYDETNLNPKQTGTGTGAIQVLKKAGSQGQAYGPQSEKFGLYDTGQYKSFRSNLKQASNIVMSEEEIAQSIRQVRAPTIYEAMNYLIPITYRGRSELNSIDSVKVVGNNSDGTFQYQIYAPLFGNGTLYGANSATIEGIISKHIEDVKPAIDQYLKALADVAESIMTRSAGTRGGKDTYFQAATRIHDVDPNSGKATLKLIDGANCGNLSLASKFQFFFFGDADNDTCSMLPLKTLIRRYLNKTDASFATHYTSSYAAPDNMTNRQLATAFFPGERQGVNEEGIWSSPFSPDIVSQVMKRNYYSTKFVPIKKLTGEEDSFWNTEIPLIQEFGEFSADENDTATNKGDPINQLNAAELLRGFKSNVTH